MTQQEQERLKQIYNRFESSKNIFDMDEVIPYAPFREIVTVRLAIPDGDIDREKTQDFVFNAKRDILFLLDMVSNQGREIPYLRHEIARLREQLVIDDLTTTILNI